nr:hypothetical protein [Enterobacter cloacae complex sp.]
MLATPFLLLLVANDQFASSWQEKVVVSHTVAFDFIENNAALISIAVFKALQVELFSFPFPSSETTTGCPVALLNMTL